MQKRMMRFIPAAVVACLLGLAMMPWVTQAGAASPPRIDSTKHNPQPVYPNAAQYNGEEGQVGLTVRIRANGHPSNIRITKSSGFIDLDNAAVEAVLSWHYVPAKDEDGDGYSEWLPLNIEFRLPKPPAPPQPAQPTTPANSPV